MLITNLLAKTIYCAIKVFLQSKKYNILVIDKLYTFYALLLLILYIKKGENK